jgi:hypothetical protein
MNNNNRIDDEDESFLGAAMFLCIIVGANGLAIWCEWNNPKSFLQELGTMNRKKPDTSEEENSEPNQTPSPPVHSILKEPTTFRSRRKTKLIHLSSTPW